MTRDILFQSILENIQNGNSSTLASLIVENNELAKSLTNAQLRSLDLAIRACNNSEICYPLAFVYMKTHLFDGGSKVFINTLPFATMADSDTARYFLVHHPKSHRLFHNGSQLPDCIDINNITSQVEGIWIENRLDRDILKPLPPGIRYEILTRPENVEYYQKTYPGSRVYSYLNLPKGENCYRSINKDHFSMEMVQRRFMEKQQSIK